MKALRQQGFVVGRHKTRTIMRKLGLVVRQRVAYKVTTKRDERHLAAPKQAYWLRKHPKGVVFHSDRGSQYTSKKLKSSLTKLGIKQSMGDIGACWDNAVVERFFGSLKHDWILKAQHATYESMAADVAAYMKYYNLKRLHTSNGDMTPVEYENYQLNVSTWA